MSSSGGKWWRQQRTPRTTHLAVWNSCSSEPIRYSIPTTPRSLPLALSLPSPPLLPAPHPSAAQPLPRLLGNGADPPVGVAGTLLPYAPPYNPLPLSYNGTSQKLLSSASFCSASCRMCFGSASIDVARRGARRPCVAAAGDGGTTGARAGEPALPYKPRAGGVPPWDARASIRGDPGVLLGVRRSGRSLGAEWRSHSALMLTPRWLRASGENGEQRSCRWNPLCARLGPAPQVFRDELPSGERGVVRKALVERRLVLWAGSGGSRTCSSRASAGVSRRGTASRTTSSMVPEAASVQLHGRAVPKTSTLRGKRRTF